MFKLRTGFSGHRQFLLEYLQNRIFKKSSDKQD